MRKIFSILFLIISFSSFVLGQNSSSPIIYRFSTTGIREVGTGRVVGLDALTGTQIKEIPVPLSCSQIELSLDKKKAFTPGEVIPGPKGQGAMAVDLNQETTTPFLQDKKIYRVKVSPLDGMLWVLLGEDNQILILDPNTLRIIDKIDGLQIPTDIIFTPDGNKAYVSLRANTIVLIDTQTKAMKTINGLPQATAVVTRPREMALSIDNKILYVVDKNTISIIDTDTLAIMDKVDFSNTSFYGEAKLVAHPNGKVLYITEVNGDHVYSYNLETTKITTVYTAAPLYPTISTLQDFAITPDGKILYISGFRGRAIIDAQNNSVITTVLENAFGTQNFEGIVLLGDFTIGKAPSIQTILPAANHQLLANQQFTIAWQTTIAPQSYSIASHKIELSTDGGITFNTIPGAEELKASTQSFIWQVPDIETTKAQIRVSTVDIGARRAASTTGNFSISKGGSTGDTQPPSVTFNSPKGGEKFNSGDTLQITWTSSDNVGVTSQDLTLSTDGGSSFPVTLASGLSGATQNFTYQIPISLQSDQTRLKLIVRDAAGNSSQAITANNFTISLGADTIAPTVTISQPTQTQAIVAGQPIQVKWQSTDNRAVASQALLLSFDNGKTFSQISSFGATDNSFVLNNIDKLSFTTPQAMVKITATDSSGNVGQATSLFTVSPAITMAAYQSKLLTITGIGFMSNVNNTVRLFVNDKEVTLPPNSVSNNSFSIKANKKKVNIVKGSNTVKLVVDSVMSNSFSFSF